MKRRSAMIITKKQLTKLIHESVFKALEEVKFDPKVLSSKGFETLDAAIDYVKNQVKLRFLGQGSSRTVFVIDSKRVLKMAMNDKGIAQNKAELDIAMDPVSSGIVSRIFQYDPGFKWVISELVRPLSNEEEFKRLTGIPWSIFSFLVANPTKSWRDVIGYYSKFFPREDLSQVSKSTFTDVVINSLLTMKKELVSTDLAKIGHWGKTADQRVVLLDYGFTDDVRNDYY